MIHRVPIVALAPILIALYPTSLPADEGDVHTNRPAPRVLPLPRGDDVFHFVVFGDRTGGPAAGIEVLRQAVEDTNLLDPDLVLTVGDLINGYNQTPAWMRQMTEFRAAMSKLNMPWFPVAGNHDIYWRRDPQNPEPKPAREHEGHYERHFGPLWYWFEHKDVGFLVLFTDEGHADGRARDFGDPAQQRISPAQMEWLRGALDEMKGLRHVFVFLHHPFWIERYSGSNWVDVHELLVRNGNVRAVMAGHIHRMTYGGLKDGIDYYSLATTGGSLPKEMEGEPYFGFLHHFNVVTVRKSGYRMASIPVGAVFDPKQFDALREEDGNLVRVLHHEAASPPIALALDGSARAFYKVAVRNPCSLPLEVTMSARAGERWVVAPDHAHAKIASGERREFEFACLRTASSLDGCRPPEFEMKFDVLTPAMRIAMPGRTLRARTSLRRPADGFPHPEADGHFAFDGESACLRIEPDALRLPRQAFTVEAWVRPGEMNDGSVVSNQKGDAGFGLEISGTPIFVVGVGDQSVCASASERLPAGEWSHIAGVYDDQEICLFVNGRRAGTTITDRPIAGSAAPLYVAARPSRRWNLYNYARPEAFFAGAIDDLRISAGVRYGADFKPQRSLSSDGTTVLHMHNDQRFGPFAPAATPLDVQALIEGEAELICETP